MVSWIRDSLRAAGLAPLAVFLLHLFISQALGAYLALPYLDIPMHVAGGVAIAYFTWRATGLASAEPMLGRITPFARAALSLTATATAAVVWEFAEWSTDQLGLTHAQLSLDDTLLDLLLGSLGGLVWLACVQWWPAPAQRS